MFSSIVSTCFDSFLLLSLGGIPSHAAPLDHVGVIPDAYSENISTVAWASAPQKTHAPDQIIGVVVAKNIDLSNQQLTGFSPSKSTPMAAMAVLRTSAPTLVVICQC